MSTQEMPKNRPTDEEIIDKATEIAGLEQTQFIEKTAHFLFLSKQESINGSEEGYEGWTGADFLELLRKIAEIKSEKK